MKKRIIPFLLALCLLLPLFPVSLAEEAAEDVFVSPTRNPNAAEYSTTTPEELQKEQIVAHSFLLMERSTGEILMSQNEDELMFPASTTKIMTALLALMFGNPDDIITITEEDLQLEDGASVVPFRVGEEVTLKDVLAGALVCSGNEAANAIARYVAGSVPAFAEKMNEVARLLGCTNTHFANANGLHDELHVTTAHDLAIIMDYALNEELFREIIGSPSYTLAATNKNPARVIENTNVHIKRDNNYYYKYSIGGKTGFTSKAGYCMVEAGYKNGVELIAVILYSGEYSRWPDTSRLLAYGFSQYKSVTPEEIYALKPAELQVTAFSENDANLGRLRLAIEAQDPDRDVRITGKNDEIDEFIDNYSHYTNISWTHEARAPVTAGEVMGVLTFYPDNEEAARYNLVATRSITAREDAPLTLEEIERKVAQDDSVFPAFSLSWVLPPVIIGLAAIWVLKQLGKLLIAVFRPKTKLPEPKKRSWM